MPGPRLALCAALCLAAACGRAPALVVSAAISLKEPLEEVRGQFAAAHPGVTVELNLGGSGDLARQVRGGAPVDVYVAAGARHMDALERDGLVTPGTRRTVAGNVLVVVTRPGGPALAAPADLAGAAVQRLAIGTPQTVPAGEYAEQWLRGLGLWERVRPRLVYTENARQALDYVARGEVDAAVVYATDVPRAPVREALRAAPGAHRPIEYPAAVVRTSARPGDARAFVDLLAGPAGRAALARHGFAAPGVAAR
ncbi:MAG TPA: molybdate ABC transporter substrate-binding protein [Polyangia bacterium]|jgi:molybdate transport system substrate-binding protein